MVVFIFTCPNIFDKCTYDFDCSYDELKCIVTSVTGGHALRPTLGEKFIAGACAGAFAQVIINNC